VPVLHQRAALLFNLKQSLPRGSASYVLCRYYNPGVYVCCPLLCRAHPQPQPCNDRARPALPPVWLLLGLGARGFVYHAWLGKVLAAAVINDDEALLPTELLAWEGRQEQQVGWHQVISCQLLMCSFCLRSYSDLSLAEVGV